MGDGAPIREHGASAHGERADASPPPLFPPNFDDRRFLPSQRGLMLALVALLLLTAVAIVAVVRQTELGEAGPGMRAKEQRLAREETVKAAAQALPALPVEPVKFLDLPPQTAREINASVPFSTDANPAARGLRLDLLADDEARAVDCLAAAGWYEAGDDAVGEQAVIQVILNRMRHPAFPKSICEVVFQGSERKTGCQFSFTCDGAMRRRPSDAAWDRARSAATAGISGLVYAPVGYATHYHTDWVVPNWSRNVDKITAVDTHLFFRWRGANGRPAAFTGVHRGSEPIVAKMAALSPAHVPPGAAPPPELPVAETPPPVAGVAGSDDAAAAVTPPVSPVPAAALRDNRLVESDGAKGIHVIGIASDGFSGTLALVALDICKGTARACTVVGFLGQPGRVTGDAVGRVRWPDRRPDFYYFSDRSRGRETIYWNCDTLKRSNAAQCMPPDFVANG